MRLRMAPLVGPNLRSITSGALRHGAAAAQNACRSVPPQERGNEGDLKHRHVFAELPLVCAKQLFQTAYDVVDDLLRLAITEIA